MRISDWSADVCSSDLPPYDRRAEARYNSLRDYGSARFQQTAENYADSFGYSVATNYSDGSTSASGQIDYIANRFDASVIHTAYGQTGRASWRERVCK